MQFNEYACAQSRQNLLNTFFPCSQHCNTKVLTIVTSIGGYCCHNPGHMRGLTSSSGEAVHQDIGGFKYEVEL